MMWIFGIVGWIVVGFLISVIWLLKERRRLRIFPHTTLLDWVQSSVFWPIVLYSWIKGSLTKN